MARKGPEQDQDRRQREYEARKEAARARQAAQSRSGRDIAPIPEAVDPERRAAAEASFRVFCETYFGEIFYLAWSQDHLKVIARIEQAVLHGGLFALAMPRGSGKSNICICACLWAVLCGYREFVVLIGAEAKQAKEMLESIKTSLESNELLVEDFPEVCYPIARLEGISNRAKGQICGGEQTKITWTSDKIVLPTVAGSKASGAMLRVTGLTGRIRGMIHRRTDGRASRPDLVIVDDPQTDASARSRSQCVTRENILAKAVLGLSGPGKKIAGVMPCTVIAPGDMADNILDRDKHPEWMGERTRFVVKWPEREDLWQQYLEMRSACFREGDQEAAAATEFYRANRAEMDRGSEVAWPERFEEDELSALQHAWNKRLQLGDSAFMSEYQNQPESDIDEADDLTADQIAGKVNRIPRGVVAQQAVRLTAMIDVQKALLFWTVCAWQDDFTGYVVDYGAWPDQKKPYFSLRNANPTLADISPASGLEAAIYAGLEGLCEHILGRTWPREDGVDLRIERCLIDSNWAESKETVYSFCRRSKHAAILMPSVGKGIKSGNKPMDEWRKNPGERVGLNWRITNPSASKRGQHYLLIDTNFWKSFVHARFAVPVGDRGCLSLFGDRPGLHRLLSEHLTAETRKRDRSDGRQVDEWKLKISKPDNHWFDCLVGCAVAASVLGSKLDAGLLAGAQSDQQPKKRKTLAERMAERPGVKRI